MTRLRETDTFAERSGGFGDGLSCDGWRGRGCSTVGSIDTPLALNCLELVRYANDRLGGTQKQISVVGHNRSDATKHFGFRRHITNFEGEM